MSKLIAGMTVSLDGFVATPDGDLSPLYQDFEEMVASDYMAELVAMTGAVLMGRRTFDKAGDTDSYADDYEFQNPIFVLTHRPPERHPRESDRVTITFVTDGAASAVAQAKAAAGPDKVVQCVGGVDVLGQLLEEGLVDELHVDVVPVLLGEGLRFPAPTDRRIDLHLHQVLEVGQRTALRCTIGG
jgi:dihydrofolate reductase